MPVLLAMLVVAGLVSACAHAIAGGDRQGQVLVVLLPDTDTGNGGTHRRLQLRKDPRSSSRLGPSTRVALTQAPQIRTLSESDVKRRFAEVLATLPPPPRHFTLNFQFDSEELTDESRRLLQDVLQTVKSYPVPDIVVIGHTDTSGYAAIERRTRAAARQRRALDPCAGGTQHAGDRRPLAR